MSDGWTETELRGEVDRFEQELIAAGLRPNAFRWYVDYARRFLRWREGDYRPRDAVGPGPTRLLGKEPRLISASSSPPMRRTFRRPAMLW